MIGLGAKTGNNVSTADSKYAQLTSDVVNRVIEWHNLINFNAGTYNNTEVIGDNSNAKIQLKEITPGTYETSGNYTSNIFDTGIFLLEYDMIKFELLIPANTTAVIKCRSSDDSGNMGDWSAALSNNQELTCSGRYIQWKIDMTGDGTVTPELNSLDLIFCKKLQNIIEGNQ